MFADPASDDRDMMAPAEAWPESLKLAHEKEALGFYITGHPLQRFRSDVETYATANTSSLASRTANSEVVVAGIVASTRTMRTKKGNRMGVVLLEDLQGVVEVLVFPDTFERTEELLLSDAPVFVVAKLDSDESTLRLLASDILPMDRAREHLSKRVTVAIDAQDAPKDLAERLRPMIEEKTGDAELVFELRYSGRYTAFIRPNPYLKVRPDREFVHFLEEICGRDAVRFS